ncbi:MAG: hypothetical protein ATN36_04615 [Epulopiscium sp. Nele67-Bin005]|nr:MAG: hypothetical protein ATN36_04615 [Epulopiscium sp. Nele67-Bin005]
MVDLNKVLKTTINIDGRLDEILAEVAKSHEEVKKLRRVKQQVFDTAEEYLQDILLEYEELESMELNILTRLIYEQALEDAVEKLEQWI